VSSKLYVAVVGAVSRSFVLYPLSRGEERRGEKRIGEKTVEKREEGKGRGEQREEEKER
jgi:hypothetical protein